jgi:hypothetical protein
MAEQQQQRQQRQQRQHLLEELEELEELARENVPLEIKQATMAEQQLRQQRQHLVEMVARKNVPLEVNYIDGEIVIDLLSQIGWIDITQPGLVFDFKNYTGYKINKNDRIVGLVLGDGPYLRRTPDGTFVWINHVLDMRQIPTWVLPNTNLISRLTMLETLALRKCRSLPINFNLPNLYYLRLSNCDESLLNNNMNERSKIELPDLQVLILEDFNLAPNNYFFRDHIH